MKSELSSFIRLEILIHLIMIVIVFILNVITRNDDIVMAVLLSYSIMPFCYMITGVISATMLKRIGDRICGMFITALLCLIFLVVTFGGLNIYSQASFIDYRAMELIYGIAIPIITHVITTLIKLLLKK